MRISRALTALLAVVALSLTACGGDDSDSGDTAGGTGESSSSTDPGSEVNAGDGGTSVNFEDCSAITAEEMSPLLGAGAGSSEVPPGGGGCNYALEDPGSPSVILEQFGTDDFADGFDGARDNIANTAIGAIDGDPTSVDGVGDGAEVVVGTNETGGTTMSIGLVLVGDTIVRATVLPGGDLDDAAINELTSNVLKLVASKA